MHNDHVLSLDIGASYTKIALRKGFYGGVKKRVSKFFMEDERVVLIPSMAIRTNREKTPWIFGLDAALTKPDVDMKVYNNWKEHLYDSESTAKTVRAFHILGEFLSWLRAQLIKSGVKVHKVTVRVAVPALTNANRTAQIIAELMELKGWGSPKILKATEPHANAIGLMSKGKNILHINKKGKVNYNYGEMLAGSTYIDWARKAVLFNNKRMLRTLIIDIGGFTTDYALLTFDVLGGGANDAGDGLKNIFEKSLMIGVTNQFDKILFNLLESRHGFNRSELNFLELEELKRKIYDGETYELVNNAGKVWTLGEKEDQKLIESQAEQFSNQIWDGLIKFLDEKKDKGLWPDEAFLTGGGTLINPIRKKLEYKIKDSNIKFNTIAQSEHGVSYSNWSSWEKTGQSMNRLATAAGGSSIILEASKTAPVVVGEKDLRSDDIPVTRPMNTVPCRCSGGNKDCCYCGGRGYYVKTNF